MKKTASRKEKTSFATIAPITGRMFSTGVALAFEGDTHAKQKERKRRAAAKKSLRKMVRRAEAVSLKRALSPFSENGD